MWRSIYHELRRRAKVSRRAAAAYKRTEITVETDQFSIIQKSRTTRAWCAECGREVDMVGLQVAGALSGLTQPGMQPPMLNQPPTTEPMLPGCGERPGWHWSQAEDGSPLVCLKSLLNSQQPGS